MPNVILAISPCRCASTVFMRVFGYAGIPAHFQPLKRIYRWDILGRDEIWKIPPRPDGPVFFQETIGPHTPLEASFDPLSILFRAGYPTEKIHDLLMGRDPVSVWSSWKDWWEGSTSVALFNQTFRTAETIRLQELQKGIKITTFLYEALRENETGMVIQSLFQALGVEYTPQAIRGWHQLPGFGQEGSNVFWYDGPPVNHQWGVTLPNQGGLFHERVKQSDGLEYFSRAKDSLKLPEAEQQAILEADLHDIYASWRKACEKDLGITVKSSG
jgi:hypothetical protein